MSVKLNKLGVKNSLWNNIRANKGSGKKPTKEMLEQERKIKAQEKKDGGPINPIYVTDRNDPRLRSYNDSLSLHRQYYTDLDALRAELAEDDRTINRIGSLPFNRYSYQSNYASDPIKPESIVGFRSPEIDYTWQIPYYRKPVQPVVYRKPATVSPTGTVRNVPVETVAPVLPKRETLLPISTDVVPMQTAGSYSEPTLMPDNLPRVVYEADEPRASIMYPYSAAANLATMNKPVGYGKDTDGTEVEFSAEEWDKMKGTKYSEFNKPEKKKLGGWLNKYN